MGIYKLVLRRQRKVSSRIYRKTSPGTSSEFINRSPSNTRIRSNLKTHFSTSKNAWTFQEEPTIEKRKLSVTSRSVPSTKSRATWSSRSSIDRTSLSSASKTETSLQLDKHTSSWLRRTKREVTSVRPLNICWKFL